jgi:hypothetical protein
MIPDPPISSSKMVSGILPALPPCPICLGQRRERFQARLLAKYEVRYFLCDSCGLLQTEEPYWLAEAYGRAIADADTGLVSRNLDIATRLSSLLYFCFDPKARYLEFAGGYGLLTRLMRDRGFDFHWHDPYCENVFARGFEWDRLKGIGSCGAVTAFEVIEHVLDPAAFVRNALTEGKANTVIFSTLLYEGEPPLPEQWWYYALATGQHISFFRRETLMMLADKLGLRLYSNGWFHALTSERINYQAFRLCTSRLSRLTGAYVQLRMPSKTSDDHQLITDRHASDSGRSGKSL